MAERLTVEDLKKCGSRLIMHMRMQGGALFVYQCVEHPRLTWRKQRDRRTWSRTWLVDNKPVPSLAAAVAALNGEPFEEPPVPKLSLSQLIAEAEREAHMRIQLYPGWVQKGKLKQSVADHRIEAMEQIAAVLQRLADNLPMFKTLAKMKEAVQQHPDVQQVLNEFPGAEVVGVSEQEEMKLEQT